MKKSILIAVALAGALAAAFALSPSWLDQAVASERAMPCGGQCQKMQDGTKGSCCKEKDGDACPSGKDETCRKHDPNGCPGHDPNGCPGHDPNGCPTSGAKCGEHGKAAGESACGGCRSGGQKGCDGHGEGGCGAAKNREAADNLGIGSCHQADGQ